MGVCKTLVHNNKLDGWAKWFNSTCGHLKMRKKQQRMFNLWQQNNCCHWCHEPTVLVFRSEKHQTGTDKIPFRKDEAALDHLYPRFHPKRQIPNTRNEQRIVLACWECNHERGKQQEKELGIEELHIRAGQSPENNSTG